MSTEPKTELEKSHLTPTFVTSFPNIFQPNEYEGKKKYGCTALFNKSEKKDWKKLLDLVEAAAKDKWGKPSASVPLFVHPLKDGDKKADDSMEGKYENYRDHHYLMFQSEYAPGVVNRDREDILDPDEIYPGCIGRAIVNVYAWEYKNNKGAVMKRGVSFGLQHYQKWDDGERLGSTRTSAADAFGGAEDQEVDV